MHDREPVGQTINSIIRQLNELARLLHDPATYDEVAAEESALWTVKNGSEWILSWRPDARGRRPHGED